MPSSSSPTNAAFNPYQPPPRPAFSPVGQPPFVPPTPTAYPMPGMAAPGYGAPSPYAGQPPFPGPPTPYGPPMGVHSPYPQAHPAQPPKPSGPRVPSTTAPGMSPRLPQAVPGLPQRPTGPAPNLSKDEMAQMHTPFVPRGPYDARKHRESSAREVPTQGNDAHHTTDFSRFSSEQINDSVDQLIQNVTSQSGPEAHAANDMSAGNRLLANAIQVAQDVTMGNTPVPEVTESKTEPPGALARQPPSASATPTPGLKSGKKSKTKSDANNTKMVYSDGNTSPEEKMAKKARYAFQRSEPTEMVTGPPTASVSQPAGDVVRDSQDAHPGS
jgi:hypothetical protein